MEQWIGQIASSLLVGAITGAVTVQLGLRRFRHERWWEKRYEAYANAIAAVSELHYLLLREMSRQSGAEHHPAIEVEMLQAPIKEVHRATASGGLLLSLEMSKLLASLGPRLQASGTSIGVAMATVSEVLVKANDIARHDLSLPSRS